MYTIGFVLFTLQLQQYPTWKHSCDENIALSQWSWSLFQYLTFNFLSDGDVRHSLEDRL